MKKRMQKYLVMAIALAFSATMLAGPALKEAAAQDKYPSRAVEYIVGYGAGGGSDQLARKSGFLIEKVLGVPFPVLNVPGATGGTAITKLLAAPADGQSIVVYIADSHAVLATGGASWKMSDLMPVARLMLVPSFLFVSEKSRFNSWSDFEKEAKAKPGTLKVGTVGFGSVDDITLTYMEGKGVKIIQVPYPNRSEGYAACIGNHVDAMYEQAGDVRQYINSKQMRPILIFGDKRLPAFKDVPCSKEAGYDIGLPQFRSVAVKAGTDPSKVKILSDAFEKVAATPEFKAFLEEQYATADSFMNHEVCTKYILSELDTMTKTWGAKKK